jgi:hypothetical protein
LGLIHRAWLSFLFIGVLTSVLNRNGAACSSAGLIHHFLTFVQLDIAQAKACSSGLVGSDHATNQYGPHGGPYEFHRQDAGATQKAPSPVSATQDGFTYIRHGASTGYALRVTLDTLPAGFEDYEGTTMWATAPFEVCENSGNGLSTPPTECGPAPGLDKTLWVARLTCNSAAAHYTDWSALGTVHLFDETIVPGGTYLVQSILDGCGIGFAGNYSAANSLPTSLWGDIVLDVTQCPPGAGNGNVDIVGDVVSIINKFSNVNCAVGKSRADLEPGSLDFQINIIDALHTLNAFTGTGYPFVPAAPPCP